MLKILQRSEKDERWWGGWWQGNGQWHWGCEEFGWKRDVEPHEGWDLCLCGSSGGNGGGGIDGSDGKGGGSGVDGSGRKSGVGDGGESIVIRSISGGGSIMYR